MGFRHNNVLHDNHFRKEWQDRVKTWFNQPGKKVARRHARAQKAAASGLRPNDLLRPAVHPPTLKYNRRLREGRGFTIEELKAAGIVPKKALAVGIPVDHRRRNKSEESLKLNVARLEAYKARLVVFPRKSALKKAGKPAAIDGISSVASAFPLPVPQPEAPRPVEASDESAFVALRKARQDFRLSGIRRKAAIAREEEEAAKKK